MTDFNNAELRRYSRQLVMPEIGSAGQARLKNASVLCVGAGGLGSPAALYLAAAGVGRLGIVEFDHVDLSNLQRQILYQSDEQNRPKLEAAAARLRALNPEIEITPHATRLAADNVETILAGYDVVLDGSDNFPTRYLVNEACVRLGKPDVHASVLRFEGQLSVFDASRGPCLRCLFPEPPPAELVPSCAEGGVLGAVPGILGSLQALEAIKLLLGIGQPLIGRLLLFDGLALQFRELPLARDPDCPSCASPGRNEVAGNYEVFTASWAESPACSNAGVRAMLPAELAARWHRGDSVLLLDVRQAEEFALVHIEGAKLIPLDELGSRIGELDPAAEYVITCHHGKRSIEAYHQLSTAGFGLLQVLAGGIDAWAREVDRALPRY